MKKSRLGRPSPAMVVAIAALVMAMVGTGYAAIKLPKKSVGTAQLKAKAVTNAKIKNNTITGKKLKLNTLGTVPSAATAGVANTVLPNAVHVVGAPGEPGFQGGSANYGSLSGIANAPVASFIKDHDNIVHLEGIVKKGAGGPIPGTLFQLPPGFRPPSGTIVVLEVPEEQQLLIAGSNVVIPGADISGLVIASGGTSENVILTGVSFFAGS